MALMKKISGEWKAGIPYIKVNGEWKTGAIYLKVNGEWVLCSGFDDYIITYSATGVSETTVNLSKGDFGDSDCSILKQFITDNIKTKTNVTLKIVSKLPTAKTIKELFSQCKGLVSVDLSEFNTSNVTDMSYLFNNCQALTTLNLTGLDTSNVTHMRYMFYGCVNLESLDVSNWNTSKLFDMGYMFGVCRKLNVIGLNDLDVSNVGDMKWLFYNNKFTSLDLSNWKPNFLLNTAYMFYACNEVVTLDLTGLNTSDVDDMNSMFKDATKLTTINVGEGWVVGSDTDITDMFSGCGTDHVTVVSNV